MWVLLYIDMQFFIACFPYVNGEKAKRAVDERLLRLRRNFK